MTLARRVVACLDVKDGRVVKGTRFVNLRDAGDPVELATVYDREGADEVVFLDITASHEGRGIMEAVVRRTAEALTIPFTVGGGLSTAEDLRRMLRAGADKVGINTAAVQRPELIREGAERYGSQCIVVAIDAKRIGPAPGGRGVAAGAPRWEVFTHGGRRPAGLDAVEWALRTAALGAGEILLTSMDQDGREDGFDLDLVRTVTRAVRIPVIASGGAGAPRHFVEAVTVADADAVLAASVFHYRTYSITAVKAAMAAAGIPVRPAGSRTAAGGHA
ncbi:MAG TPA: imidazole glycerol phosphate synthase subunit HisF [bacterium]|nr:imidazole glycerol phosphate synthase subunit HisF [bacterium]